MKLEMEVGIDKKYSTETRNDGITVRKSLLWHLLQHSSVSYIGLAWYKLLNAKVGIFSL